jgi:hypothetical protein
MLMLFLLLKYFGGSQNFIIVQKRLYFKQDNSY